MSTENVTVTDGDEFSDVGEWLTAEGFVGMEGMPGTAKGARLRLEKLTALHPEIRRKRTRGKGFLYHISAAGMSLQSERDAAGSSTDEQLNLWIQLFRTMKPASREKLLQLALAQVAADLGAASKLD
ncbi:hypothetical protein M975_1210 [Buttiauxella brennerae ATCC 51605]|uniref:HTH Mu-type domain-containing protein n=1 Tax=Buttiauxella brennerae ATCC 51605 TaxID=1354251 RepID=A0A1B7ISJ0_9ENTR|nr:hypothetical protein [Buttiauxella brennerae]OAT32773.1 hypothetical protein M975_1210 [Buttiauxella brennerae ATCC 51605]